MTESGPSAPQALAHGVTRMSGRDPNEPHRAATPLELLFDLTFVVGFGVAAEQLAHLLAEGHLASGLLGFGFAMFAVCLAWINFSWFASAYDTDDWPFRVATMVQMVGVLIFTLGLPDVFASIDHGPHLNNAVAVAGYVVMRIAMGFQWLRAAAQDPGRRSACLTYLTTILVAQVGWVLLLLVEASVSVLVTLLLIVPLALIELAGPWIAETRKGGTPWHAHHLTERYGLLAIIALGEGVIGTVASLAAVVEHQGWTLDAVLVGVAGTGLTFGMWWTYFIIPSAGILQVHRERFFAWGYGHILIFAAIAGTGAGLHVAASYIEGQAHIGGVATVLCVAVPVGGFVLMVYALHTWLVREADPFHLSLLAGTAAVLVAAVWLAAAGVPMAWCLLVVTLAPAVTVVGYEAVGHRHLAAILNRSMSRDLASIHRVTP
jgi:low temperature requirement protein LtrA